MVLALLDVSLSPNLELLSAIGQDYPATRQLILNIIAESDDLDIPVHDGFQPKRHFVNHSYNLDPATNGGILPGSAKCAVYYCPATNVEAWAYRGTVDAAFHCSGRRRMFHRQQNGESSFFLANHPKLKPGKPVNNNYNSFRPVDCTR